jgi:hypothetical protein
MTEQELQDSEPICVSIKVSKKRSYTKGGWTETGNPAVHAGSYPVCRTDTTGKCTS